MSVFTRFGCRAAALSRMWLLLGLVGISFSLLPSPVAAQRMAWWHQSANTDSLEYTPGERLRFHFERTVDWDAGDGQRGFIGILTVASEEPGTVFIEQVNFVLDAQITDAWNGALHEDDGRFRFRPESWNTTIEQGQSRTFGFMGTYSGQFAEPHDFRMSGRVTEYRPEHPSIIPGCPLETRSQIRNVWPTADERFSFAADINVRNSGPAASSWQLGLETDAEVESTPNATHVRIARNINHYLIAPGAWNDLLEPEATIVFSVTGNAPTQEFIFTVSVCPDPEYEDPADRAFLEKWLELSSADRQRYSLGVLVFNGSSFVPSSPLLRPAGVP